MNRMIADQMVARALARDITFPEILATLSREGVESYHVDFLRDECRFYAGDGDSYATPAPMAHEAVAPEFSAERLADINRRVQAGQAGYPDFVREGAAAGCAYYIVYVNGRKVRYFGRDGGEHVQILPGAARQGVSP